MNYIIIILNHGLKGVVWGLVPLPFLSIGRAFGSLDYVTGRLTQTAECARVRCIWVKLRVAYVFG